MRFRRVFVEISNVQSPGCSLKAIERTRPEFMTAAAFSHVLDEVSNETDCLWLNVEGEPMMNPSFEPIMDLCDHAEMHVILETNGIHLSSHPHLYMHGCLHQVRIDLNQSAFYPYLNLADYMDAILSFAERCSSMHHPLIELLIDSSSENNAIQYCINRLQRRYSLPVMMNAEYIQLMEGVGLNLSYRPQNLAFSLTPLSNHGHCQGGKEELAILTNANVVPCARDIHGEIAFDNLRMHTLNEVFNTGRYRRMMKGYEENKLTEPLCTRCPYCTARYLPENR